MYYAIGDIHGEFSLLLDLYEKILYDIRVNGEEKNTIVFLGDYIDRGEASIRVLNFLRGLENTDNLNHVFIRGNHEDMFMCAVENPLNDFDVSFWVRNGGEAVLKELNMDWDHFREAFPHQPIYQWLKDKTRFYHETDCYIFVHGGLDTRRDVCSQLPDVLMWARNMEPDHYKGYRKKVIHGHTPHPQPVVDDNRICVDTSFSPNEKILTAVALRNEDDGSFRFLQSTRPL